MRLFLLKIKKYIKKIFAFEKPWYTKWWLWTLALLFILTIPVIINELYIIGYLTGEGYLTLWEAKDILAFYGSFLSFIGTISLGALALHQNKVFKEENDKMNRQLMRAQIFSNCAFYRVYSCRLFFDADTNTFEVNLHLKNIGKSVAVITIPFEFEFSRYAYKCNNNTQDIFLQICETPYANVLSDGVINFSSKDISLDLIDAYEVFYAHISLSIVSENQMQYDQILQMRFEKVDGSLKYDREYPAQFYLNACQ